MPPDPTQDSGLRIQDGASPPSPSHRLTVSPPHPTITPRDRELLNALDDPSTIDPVEYAEWIERPEIQRAIAARDNLRAREEHAKLTRFRDRVLTEASAALDTLKATLSCHPPCHREAPSGDSLPSSTPSTKLVGAEPPSDQQLLEARRAATSITRLAQACLRPIPSSPLGGGVAAWRSRAATEGASSSPASTLSHRAGTALERPALDAGSLSRAHALTRSPAQASPPSPLSAPPSRTPASRVPGLEAAIAAFLRAAGTPDAAAPLIAAHRARDIGDNLTPWLISRTTPLRNPTRPTRVYYHDRYDAADQFVEITHAGGARSQSIIHAVLERHPDRTPARWAIADVTHDTSWIGGAGDTLRAPPRAPPSLRSPCDETG